MWTTLYRKQLTWQVYFETFSCTIDNNTEISNFFIKTYFKFVKFSIARKEDFGIKLL